MLRYLSITATLLLLACNAPVKTAASNTSASDVELATTILKDSIEIPTVEGRGRVPELAAYYARVLMDAGFSKEDIEITPMGETATFALRFKGSEQGPPTLLIGHMDVVVADPADWTRDPFTAIEEDGYIFGRGSYDNKLGIAVQIATLVKLKRENYQPRHDVILALSGDEETAQATTVELVKKYKDASLVLNSDMGRGTLDDNDKPQFYRIQAAEKSYSDFEIEFTNPGGHSSRPRRVNAINQLANALTRIGAYQFEPQRNELTNAALSGMAEQVDSKLGDAMRRFVSDPNDTAAIEALRNDPEYIGQIGTTCVATVVNAGHAVNALPQKAMANINCRIFPGVSAQEVKDELLKVIDDPAAKITIAWEPGPNPASPLRKDVMDAITKAVHAEHPGLPIIPSMSPGSTDCVFFRASGIDCYGVNGLYIRPTDSFAHGLNERVPVASIPIALAHWDSIIRSLTADQRKLQD